MRSCFEVFCCWLLVYAPDGATVSIFSANDEFDGQVMHCRALGDGGPD